MSSSPLKLPTVYGMPVWFAVPKRPSMKSNTMAPVRNTATAAETRHRSVQSALHACRTTKADSGIAIGAYNNAQ